MNVAKLSNYPFLTQAADYVADMGTSIENILTSRAFDIARYRAQIRVIQAIQGEITQDKGINNIAELLSYPISRIIISCIDDAFLIRRYGLAEAKSAYVLMKREGEAFIQEIGKDFDINATITEGGFRIHFTDYIRGAAGMRALNWKLVNRRLNSGFVNITKEEYARLLQEAIRGRISASLPLEVPDRFCKILKEDIEEIKIRLEASKSEFDEEGFGDVAPDEFPPCVVHLLSNVQAGVNLPHSARFALTSFLINIGLTVDQIIQMFNVSPDFNEEMTRYQVDHISGGTGTNYKPPSCATMITYGNCFGKDELCKNIGHPLSYYRNKKKNKNPTPTTNKKAPSEQINCSYG